MYHMPSLHTMCISHQVVFCLKVSGLFCRSFPRFPLVISSVSLCLVWIWIWSGSTHVHTIHSYCWSWMNRAQNRIAFLRELALLSSHLPAIKFPWGLSSAFLEESLHLLSLDLTWVETSRPLSLSQTQFHFSSVCLSVTSYLVVDRRNRNSHLSSVT